MRTRGFRCFVFTLIIGIASLVNANQIKHLFQRKNITAKNEKGAGLTLPTPSIRFSSLGNNRAQEEFDKPEMVYALLEFPSLVSGSYTLEVHWKRPDGMTQEASFIPIRFPESGGQRVDLWLQFHDSANGFDIFHVASDENRHMFNGSWTLETMIDGNKLASASFRISGY